ncbi:MAG: non-canonical purine NTP pyrophosphatase [Myxococcota bacterium]|nr:non-canonical purine NTP pyrophosphatase [Myxococcota bacterium]
MWQLEGRALVIASHNAGKAREVADLFRPLVGALRFAAELGLPEPVEDGATFVENASIKARAAAAATGELAVSDDSGLVVFALDGAPGVHAKRWGGGDYERAMRKVHEALGDRDRAAEMVCALVIAAPDGSTWSAEGRVRGQLTWPPRGQLGFGYEPMFVPEGERRTYGEMERDEKHRDDPRARAFGALRLRANFPEAKGK